MSAIGVTADIVAKIDHAVGLRSARGLGRRLRRSPLPTYAGPANRCAVFEIRCECTVGRDGTAPILKKYGAKFLVRGGKTLSVAGEPPKRIALYTFEDMDKAAAFVNDLDLKALAPIRDKSSKYRAYVVEGAN